MFDTIEDASLTLRLRGLHARAEVSVPVSGVWRYRVRPKGYLFGLDLPEKHSFAVQQTAPQPLTVHEAAQGWQFGTAAGETRFDLSADGSAEVRFAGEVVARLLRLGGEFTPAEPVNLASSTLVLHAPREERYLGFGEKNGSLDKRGRRLTFWNTDVQPHHPDTDPLYQSIPFFLALREGRSWGFFLDEPSRSVVDVGKDHPEQLCWKAESPELDMYFILGESPAQVLARYTALTGRTPLPPLWALGLHQSRYSYETTDEVENLVRTYRRLEIPLDVVHLDIHHMDAYKVFTFDKHRFPDPARLGEWAGEQHVKLVSIVDPGVKQEAGYDVYEEAAAADYLVRVDRGDVFVGEVWPDPAVFPDFTRPEVRQWWGSKHAALLERGVSGVWNDMNEPSCFSAHVPVHPARLFGLTLPDDARHGKRRHLEVHNVYGLSMCQATYEGLRRLRPHSRPFVLTRAGYAGIQRYATVWSGDNSAHWEHMEMNLQILLGLGLSGVPFVGSDVGGFLGHASGELVTRWTWLGAFFPFMRNHSAIGTDYQEPWAFPEHFACIKAAVEFRYRLLPYLYTLMHEARETGLPPMRALALAYPHLPEASRLADQFLFGENLLVAPILRPGHTHRSAFFPDAGWQRFLGDSAQGQAEGYAIVQAQLDEVPVFLRAGGVVPLTEPASHTTTAWWDTLHWHVNVAQSGSFSLYEDDGDGYQPGLSTILRIERTEREVRLLRAGRSRGSETLTIYGDGERPPYVLHPEPGWTELTLSAPLAHR